MPRIAYTYGCPSNVGPSDSVGLLQECVEAVGGLRPGDTVALDIEDPAVPDGTDLSSWCAEWGALARQVFKLGDRKPRLYSAHYYMSTHNLENAGVAEQFWLWYASYQSNRPPIPMGWPGFDIWQYDVSTDGFVAGVTNRCDLDVFYGTVDDLRALGLPEVAEPLVTVIERPQVDPVTDALNNVFDLTLNQAIDEHRRRSAQAAIAKIKGALGRE